MATSGSPRAPWIGLLGTVALVAVAMAVPAVTGWDVHVMSFPPLHADWDPRVGQGTVPAVLIALLAVKYAVDMAATLAWRRLLVVVFVTGMAWMLALAFVDGSHGVSKILGTQYEYLRTAHRTTNLPHTLDTYISRIPYGAAPYNWPVHIAGHPPGALTFFVVLVRLGLGSGFAAGMVVTVFAATTAVAVMVTARLLGAEDMARKAAPLLVLGPAAIWQCVSADGMFAAVAAWGIAALALAATRTSWGPMLGASVVSGLLLGYAVMLSYGLPVLAVLAVAVLVVARSWRPLVPTALAAAVVLAVYAAYGYQWWEALGPLHDRYWAGVAAVRPAAYWNWADLAALACSAGPVAGAGLAYAGSLVRAERRDSDPARRVVLWLSGGGLAMVLVADASQMSKGEVERIWLPFVPWLLLATALLPEKWRRGGLALQLVVALVIQHLLFTGW
ncbi:MAG TPA: hypothetical protein VHZ06_05960 [Marmoricola sp.]|jgi:hypothetical protein|nr:hypothetical protein [Marmoricola sp.]